MTTLVNDASRALTALVGLLGAAWIGACVDPVGPHPGDDDDALGDDDVAGDDDDDTAEANAIGIAIGITVNHLDEADWPEVVATIEGATIERSEDTDWYRVPADGAWHAVTVLATACTDPEVEDYASPDCYMHAECDVRVQGDLLKVRVVHAPEYTTYYEYVSDFGHWDGDSVEFEYEEGETLVVPLNVNPTGEWGCVVDDVSESMDWIDVEFGEKGSYLFENNSVFIDGHGMVAPAGDWLYSGVVDTSGESFTSSEGSANFTCSRL